MEANAPVPWIAVALLSAAALAAVAMTATGHHDPTRQAEFCDPGEAVNTTPYKDAARLRSTGYVEPEDLPDVVAVDEPPQQSLVYTWDVGPDVFADETSSHPNITEDVHVVAHPLEVVYHGIPNNPDFLGSNLPEDAPETVLQERARPGVSTEEKSLVGIHKIEMVFSGRIQVWEKETYECHLHDEDKWKNYSAHRVTLEGYGTNYASAGSLQEDKGLGTLVDVGPGPRPER